MVAVLSEQVLQRLERRSRVEVELGAGLALGIERHEQGTALLQAARLYDALRAHTEHSDARRDASLLRAGLELLVVDPHPRLEEPALDSGLRRRLPATS